VTGIDNERRIVQAVLVLYRRSPSESDAFVSFTQVLNRVPHLRSVIRLLLYDNSPVAATDRHFLPEGVDYIHNPNNGGLVAAYDAGLASARSHHIHWLMLLDQDTLLTGEYLEEVLDSIESADSIPQIAAIVPRLVERGFTTSPSTRQLIRDRALPPEVTGLVREKIYAFNSGSVIRIAALDQIGGFPKEFPIDALDHAVFHLLQENGGHVFVMRAQIEHSLSMNNRADSMSLDRYNNVLAAEALYTSKYGGPWTRLRMHIRFLILLVKQLGRREERRFAPITLSYLVRRAP
jgi:GT2 family glycosyltransferase